MARITSIVLAAFLLAGCVPQDKYNALRLERDQLAEQLGSAESSERAARAARETAEKQLTALMARGDDEKALSRSLQEENAQLREQYAALQGKYDNAVSRTPQFIGLPAELSNALEAFAAQYPDLVEFDKARGMVKFKSDVTFAKGSAELTPQAKLAVDKFATILNSQAASAYEFVVAGHTDSTPVNNPNTRLAGHKDNWYLSSHRAISVGQELIGQGVNQKRIGMLGYGDQRPVASNGTEDGRAKNRRVEVLLLPSSVKGGSYAADGNPAIPTNNGARKTAPVTPKNNLNKDSATIENRPILNK